MIQKTMKSFRYATRGIGKVIKTENNAKVHLIATVAVVFLGFFMRISLRDWCWLIVSMAFVWVTEIINTCIEKIVDIVSPEYSSKAGAIKDMAAGAVLIAAIAALLIGCLVFYPYI
jgi:diacylglycerol kinase